MNFKERLYLYWLEIKLLVLDILHIKTFWVVLLALGLFLYAFNHQYEGVMVSRGVESSKVIMRNTMTSYTRLVDTYEEKTDNQITTKYLTSNKVYQQGLKNGNKYHLNASQVYTIFYHKPFSITGQVILKVRMPDNFTDYMEISDGQDVYGIYLVDSLPPQVKGDTIEVTGIVLGHIKAGQTNETVLVTSYLNVSDAPQVPNTSPEKHTNPSTDNKEISNEYRR